MGFANILLTRVISHHLCEGLSRFPLESRRDIPVYLHCKRRRSMAQTLLDNAGVGTSPDQPGSMAVAQVMEANSVALSMNIWLALPAIRTPLALGVPSPATLESRALTRGTSTGPI